MATTCESVSVVSRVMLAVTRQDAGDPGAVQSKVAVPPARSTAGFVALPPQSSVRLTTAPESTGIGSNESVAESTDLGVGTGSGGRCVRKGLVTIVNAMMNEVFTRDVEISLNFSEE